MSFHKNLAAGEIHQIHNWVVANAAARAALVLVSGDIGKVCLQSDTGVYYLLRNNVGPDWYGLTLASAVDFVCIPIACGDETTAITTGAGKVTFDIPFAMTLIAVGAGVNSGQASGSIFTVNVKKNGSSIFTTKITIDNTETTTNTAATPSALVTSPTTVAAWDRFTVDVDQVGTGAPTGLKLYFTGTKP